MVRFFSREKDKVSTPEHLFFLSLCFFVISLYSPVSQINNLAIVLIGLAWVRAGYYKNLKFLFQNKIAFGLLLFYCWQALTLFYSNNKAVGSMWLEYRSPMVYLPVLLATANPSSFAVKKILLFFAWCSALAAVLGLLCGIILTLHTGDSGYLYNDNLGILFDRQAVYFGMYVNFAIVLFIWFLQTGGIQKPVYRNLAVLSICLMMLLNYLLASRVAMAVLLLFLITYIVYLIIRKKNYLNGSILLFGIIILAVLASQLFPKTVKRMVSVTNSNYEMTNLHPVDHFNGETSKENWNSLNTRLAIWHCAGEVIRRNPLLGTGIGDADDVMMEDYRKNNFYFGVKYHLNSHNQYLDAAISYGIPGCIGFICLVMLPAFIASMKDRNVILLYFILSLGIYLVTEVMFNRNQGVTFIAFFIVILGRLKKETWSDYSAGI